ncbi:MBL fold metallo-hydrolase [Reyranella aquatilis]|uniref:MBL fold metallo-hydrolase n=1 Tax=Reyranella aquatilis TaxID=2035356 RepID=A0ABS8KY43_9HYPH|nr:MBL fold metallo-hydrolase [Reyranella aquatilis]MCC8430980.1 MBL fold metallo-hydrolase [Reyranella aquatilis]
MRLQFLGSGDAFGSGGRFNTCFHLERAAHGNLLVDCGASSMVAIRKWEVEPNAISTVLVSHLHGDHFAGLPFFLLDAQLVSRRTEPLLLAGPPGFRDRLMTVMEAMFAGSTQVQRKFELEIRELELHERVETNGLAVTPYLMKHYSGAPSYALRIETEGKVLAYSGDTEWVEELIPAGRDADLFICEAYFFDKVMKYHIDYTTLVNHLPRIGAKRTIVTHMSAELLARPSQIALEAAHDGLVVDF